MVGNKDDLYHDEKVSYDEVSKLVNEINAVYQRTSAKRESSGIDKLFENIGKRLLDLDEIKNTKEEKENKKKLKKLLKEKNKKGKKKKNWC